jgi:hypothetical protein
VLSKKSLEFAKGASEVEEASRSGLQLVREFMRLGDPPGTLDEGKEVTSDMPTGEHVTGERKVVDHDTREIKSHAVSPKNSQDGESKIKANAEVVPSNGTKKDQSAIDCDTGGVLLAGNLKVITGPETYQGVQLSGLMLLEDGAELTLSDCILRGTILTRAGLCKNTAKLEGSHRPVVNVYGGLRLLAGNELPDTAMCAPDAVFNAENADSLEIRGFTYADEIKTAPKGTLRGMVVSDTDQQIAPAVKRPGHGRGQDSFPDNLETGAESVKRLAVPAEEIPDSVLDAMCSASIP